MVRGNDIIIIQDCQQAKVAEKSGVVVGRR